MKIGTSIKIRDIFLLIRDAGNRVKNRDWSAKFGTVGKYVIVITIIDAIIQASNAEMVAYVNHEILTQFDSSFKLMQNSFDLCPTGPVYSATLCPLVNAVSCIPLHDCQCMV